jgi:tetratricopeptide (TPR) repeat protein
VESARSLAARVNRLEMLFTADQRVAEDLHGRYPDEPRLRDLLEATLVRLATQDQVLRQYPEAASRLRRAIQIRPDGLSARQALVRLLLESSDWPAAEAAAREALALAPRDPDLLEAYAIALFRQDRNREAADAFRAVLEVSSSPTAREFLTRLQKNARDEGGMTEQRLSRFHVRYDGAEHEDVGREILRALERHYAALASAMDHQLREPVPVILFSDEAYYDASGAPRWSGGVFDNTDGRIRVPIQGLGRNLTPDMDDTLRHELTHAFVFDIAGGHAPRELNEGLAQWMEGKRLDSFVDADARRALADGRIGGVSGYYLNALGFVEDLISLRGPSGVNDLLRAIGETDDVDAAFSQVYGQDFRGAQQAFYQRFRRRYGS